jgi:hypothetical protein
MGNKMIGGNFLIKTDKSIININCKIIRKMGIV